MAEFDPSRWKAYVVAESSPGTTPNSASFVYIGGVTSAKLTPNANYKQVRASGSPDYYINQQMSLKPTGSVTVIPSNVAFLVNFVSTTAAFTLFLRNATDSMYLRFTGCYVDRLRLSCDIEDDVSMDLDLLGYSVLTTNAPGTPSIPSDDTTALKYTNVTLSKDASTITDWTTLTFDLNKNLIRLLTPSSGATRAIFTVARDHTLSFTRTMDTSTGFNELADMNADTSRTIKLLLTNVGGGSSWSVQLNTAKLTSHDADILKPEDVVGKELEYIGTTLTFGTS